MSVLSVSSGMAGEPIRRPWARCISINDDDRAQWIDNDEGGVVGCRDERLGPRHINSSLTAIGQVMHQANSGGTDDLPVTLVPGPS